MNKKINVKKKCKYFCLVEYQERESNVIRLGFGCSCPKYSATITNERALILDNIEICNKCTYFENVE